MTKQLKTMLTIAHFSYKDGPLEFILILNNKTIPSAHFLSQSWTRAKDANSGLIGQQPIYSSSSFSSAVAFRQMRGAPKLTPEDGWPYHTLPTFIHYQYKNKPECDQSNLHFASLPGPEREQLRIDCCCFFLFAFARNAVIFY